MMHSYLLKTIASAGSSKNINTLNKPPTYKQACATKVNFAMYVK
jgi:hypothetical protein